MKLREYCSADCVKITELFHDTVHSVNSKDYSQSQLDAWAPEKLDQQKWNSRLSGNYSVVAEQDDLIVGFGMIDDKGYFDLLYTHRDYQRMGVATLIAEEVERYSRNRGMTTITTDASITARPFFEQRGYLTLEQQSVEFNGQLFVNFKMRKELG